MPTLPRESYDLQSSKDLKNHLLFSMILQNHHIMYTEIFLVIGNNAILSIQIHTGSEVH